MATNRYFEVGTLHVITEQSVTRSENGNLINDSLAVPFHRFRAGTQTPELASYSPVQLLNFLKLGDGNYGYEPVHDLLPGSMVRFVGYVHVNESNLDMSSKNMNVFVGDKGQRYAVVRLVHGISARKEIDPITEAPVTIHIETENAFQGNVLDSDPQIDELYGIVDLNLFESIVLDPSAVPSGTSNDLQTNTPSGNVYKEINFAGELGKKIKWLPGQNTAYLTRKAFLKNLVDLDLKSTATKYDLKILQNHPYNDDPPGALPTIHRIALSSRSPGVEQPKKEQDWVFPSNAMSIEYGFVTTSTLLTILSAGNYDKPNASFWSAIGPLTTQPTSLPAPTSPGDPNQALQNKVWFEQAKCRYYINLKTKSKLSNFMKLAVSPSGEVLPVLDPKYENAESIKYFIQEARLLAFQKFLTHYNKIGATSPTVWVAGSKAANTGFSEKEVAQLFEAFGSCLIENMTHNRVTGYVEFKIGVDATLFDLIKAKAEGSTQLIQGQDYDIKARIYFHSRQERKRFFIATEKIPMKDIISKWQSDPNLDTIAMSLNDYEDIAEFLSAHHETYSDETSGFVRMINYDFQKESENIIKLTNAVKKILSDNGKDYGELSSANEFENSHLEIGFSNDLKPKCVLLGMGKTNSGGPYYKLSRGLADFQSNVKKRAARIVNNINFHSKKEDFENQMKGLAALQAASLITLIPAQAVGTKLEDQYNIFLSTIKDNTPGIQRVPVAAKLRDSLGDQGVVLNLRGGRVTSTQKAKTELAIKKHKPSITKKQVASWERSFKKWAYESDLAKSVKDLSQQKSFLTHAMEAQTVFGKDGLIETLGSKVNFNTFIKSALECAGQDLIGDDMIEIICNLILQNFKDDFGKIRKAVLDKIDVARADLEESMREAIGNMIDDIQSGVATTTSAGQLNGKSWDGQTRDQFLQGFGAALSAGLDDKFNPFPSETGSGGSYALSTPGPLEQPSVVGVGFSIKEASCKPPSLQEMNPNAFTTPEQSIHLMSSANFKKIISDFPDSASQLSSTQDGTKIMIWQIYMNYRLSQINAPDNLYIKNIGEAESERKFGQKTQIATLHFLKKYNLPFHDETKPYAGSVTASLFAQAEAWYNSVKKNKNLLDKYKKGRVIGEMNSTFAVDDLKEKLSGLSNPTSWSYFLRHEFSIRNQESKKDNEPSTKVLSHFIGISAKLGEMEKVVAGQMLAFPKTLEADFQKTLETTLTTAKNNFEKAFKDLFGEVKTLDITQAKEVTETQQKATKNKANANGTIISASNPAAAAIQAPSSWAGAKKAVDDLISSGTLSEEGLKNLGVGLVQSYGYDVTNFITNLLTPEQLCKYLEEYILAFIRGLAAVSKFGSDLGNGMFSLPGEMPFKLSDIFEGIGKWWVTAVLKTLDKSLLEYIRWNLWIIQAKCQPQSLNIELNFNSDSALANIRSASPVPNNAYKVRGVSNIGINRQKQKDTDPAILQATSDFMKSVEGMEDILSKDLIFALMSDLMFRLNVADFIALMRETASPLLLEDILNIIEADHKEAYQVINNVDTLQNLFKFIGLTIDLDLLITSLSSRAVIEDACDIDEIMKEVAEVTTYAMDALDEVNSLKKQNFRSAADMLMNSDKPMDIDLPPIPVDMPVLDHGIIIARDLIIENIMIAYKRDIRNLRNMFYKTGEGIEYQKPNPDDQEVKAFDQMQNFMEQAQNFLFGTDPDAPSDFDFKFSTEAFPELQDKLRNPETYRVAFVTTKDKTTALLNSKIDPGFIYENYIDPLEKWEQEENDYYTTYSAMFSYALLIDEPVKLNSGIDGGNNYISEKYLLFDPPKVKPTNAFAGFGPEQLYTTAMILNNKANFIWKSNMFNTPAEYYSAFKLVEDTKIVDFYDYCKLEAQQMGTVLETSLSTYAEFPEIAEPMLGNISRAFPIDIQDFAPAAGSIPQANLFARYIISILAKNLEESKEGVYEKEEMLVSLKKSSNQLMAFLEAYIYPLIMQNLITSYGHYISNSKFFHSPNLFKLTKALCNSKTLPLDLINVKEIKNYIQSRYKQINEEFINNAYRDKEKEENMFANTSPFEMAMFEGIVKTIIRVHLAETIIRGMWVFDRFNCSEILKNDLFTGLFANQFLSHMQSYDGTDTSLWKDIFMDQVKNLISTSWGKDRFGRPYGREEPPEARKSIIFSSDYNMIKYIAENEVSNMCDIITNIFNNGKTLKNVYEIFFDDLEYGFVRNKGDIAIQEGVPFSEKIPKSAFMFDYKDEGDENNPDRLIEFDEAQDINIPMLTGEDFDNEVELLMNGNFVIEPYIRAVDYEFGSTTSFDATFGPNGFVAAHGYPSYTRTDSEKGVISLEGFQNLANNLKETMLHDNLDENEENGLTIPISNFYKEVKYGIRLSFILPITDDGGYEKMVEAVDSLIKNNSANNQGVDRIHKSYRMVKKFKDETGAEQEQIFYIIPLTFEEISATTTEAFDDGTPGGVSANADLYNKSFGQIATAAPSEWFLQVTKYVKYPTDEDVHRIKYNLGYIDPTYKDVGGDGYGNPMPIHHAKAEKNKVDMSVEKFMAENNEQLFNNYGDNEEHVKAYDKFITDVNEDYDMFRSFQHFNNSYADIYGTDKGDIGSGLSYVSKEMKGKPWTVFYRLFLTTQYARNQYAQWLGTGVELDQQPYMRNISAAKVKRLETKDGDQILDYHPKFQPGLVGRPDYNARFELEYTVDENDDETQGQGLYPHGASNKEGCKDFDFADYKAMGFYQGVPYYDNPDDKVQGKAYIAKTDAEQEYSIDYETNKLVYGGKQPESATDIYANGGRLQKLATFKMNWCKKSPRYDQVGSTFSSGRDVHEKAGDGFSLNQDFYTLQDIYPAELYSFIQLSTMKMEDFINPMVDDFLYDLPAEQEKLKFSEVFAKHVEWTEEQIDDWEDSSGIKAPIPYWWGNFTNQLANSIVYKCGVRPSLVGDVSKETGLASNYQPGFKAQYAGEYWYHKGPGSDYEYDGVPGQDPNTGEMDPPKPIDEQWAAWSNHVKQGLHPGIMNSDPMDYCDKLGGQTFDNDLENWVNCINEGGYLKKFINNLKYYYEAVPYLHPGGMPIIIDSNKSSTDYGIGGVYGAGTAQSYWTGDDVQHRYIFSGLLQDNFYHNSGKYGVDSWLEQSKFKGISYDHNKTVEQNDTYYKLNTLLHPFVYDKMDGLAVKEYPNGPNEENLFSPDLDNIPTRLHYKSNVNNDANPMFDYLTYTPYVFKYNSGFFNSEGAKDVGYDHEYPNAAGLEPGQIWTKHADRIDFRELANKKTDYYLQKLGIPPDYWTGYGIELKRDTSGFGTVSKVIPISDKTLVKVSDEVLDHRFSDNIEESLDSLNWFAKDIDGEFKWLTLEGMNITPEKYKKYPRTRITQWNIKIEDSQSPWNIPDLSSVWTGEEYETGMGHANTAGGTFEGSFGMATGGAKKEHYTNAGNASLKGINTVTTRYVKDKTSGEVTQKTFKTELSIPPHFPNKKAIFNIETDTNNPSYEEDVLGGDEFVGFFPDKNGVEKFRKLFEVYYGMMGQDSKNHHGAEWQYEYDFFADAATGKDFRSLMSDDVHDAGAVKSLSGLFAGFGWEDAQIHGSGPTASSIAGDDPAKLITSPATTDTITMEMFNYDDDDQKKIIAGAMGGFFMPPEFKYVYDPSGAGPTGKTGAQFNQRMAAYTGTESLFSTVNIFSGLGAQGMKQFFEYMMTSYPSVESVLENSSFYYVFAGGITNQSAIPELQKKYIPPSFKGSSSDENIYIPDVLTKIYTQKKIEVNGKDIMVPAIKLTFKLAGDDINDPEDEVWLYQVGLRAGNLMKLGDIDFEVKYELTEKPPAENAGFIREFFQGDLIEASGGEDELLGSSNDVEVSSIYEYLRSKMIPTGLPDIEGNYLGGSPEFNTLFKYLFPLTNIATLTSLYVFFYGYYSDDAPVKASTNQLFGNTKNILFNVFKNLWEGGDIFANTGIDNFGASILNEAIQDNMIENGISKSVDVNSNRNAITQALFDQGLEPGFMKPAMDGSSGDGDSNMRMILEVLAGICDPGWDSFPITPIGWAALLMRRKEQEAKQEQEKINASFDGTNDPDDVCS